MELFYIPKLLLAIYITSVLFFALMGETHMRAKTRNTPFLFRVAIYFVAPFIYVLAHVYRLGRRS